MWRNIEVHDFVAWLRAHNEHLPAEARTEIHGLDIYSLGSSIAAILAMTGHNLVVPGQHLHGDACSLHCLDRSTSACLLRIEENSETGENKVALIGDRSGLKAAMRVSCCA
jgi:hypothetical protein